MPYIQYRGVEPPSPIRDNVLFEDPNAPCFDGHDKAWADARRFAENAFNDNTERAIAIDRYVDDHPYPGRKHVGGVGLIEGGIIRALDEEITADEYKTIRSEIEEANKAYHRRRAETLSTNNDPLRRANSNDEELGWRTRIWVTSYTVLEHHVPYPLGERSVAYLRVRQEDPSGSGRTAQLIDVYHGSGGQIEQAFLEGIDWADMLVDLLALAGYGAAKIERILGTTVPFCRIGEEFPLATFDADIRNAPVPVSPDQLTTQGVDDLGRLVLRHLREGLSALAPTMAFAAFWNALEGLADDEARTKNLQRMVKCTKCGTERRAGWDHKSGFEAIYREAGLDPTLFDKHRAKRGAIQHGGKLQNTGYVDEVFEDLPHVQTAALIAVAKKVGVMPGTRNYLSTCWPVTTFSCRAGEDGSIAIQSGSVGMKAAFNILPQRICGDFARRIFFGVSFQVKIDPLCLPPIQR